MSTETAPSGPRMSQAFVDWLAWHDEEVRHEHGERIAKAQEDAFQSGAAAVPADYPSIARDLSPSP